MKNKSLCYTTKTDQEVAGCLRLQRSSSVSSNGRKYQNGNHRGDIANYALQGGIKYFCDLSVCSSVCLSVTFTKFASIGGGHIVKLKFHGSSFPIASSSTRPTRAIHPREDAIRMSATFPFSLPRAYPIGQPAVCCGVVLAVCSLSVCRVVLQIPPA